MKNKIFRTTFLFIFLAEILSLCGYLLPTFNNVSFLILFILFIFISFYDLRLSVLIILVELFIGSKGYLFFLDYDGVIISIRIAFWVIFMSVWLSRVIIEFIKNKRIIFLKNKFLADLFPLFFFIGVGIFMGFIRSNNFSDIFFDLNNWFYFLLVFPLVDVLRDKKDFDDIFKVGLVSVVWLSLKTLFLLFIFSHNMIGMVYEVYRWVRVSGIGEITQMDSGFSRIFFQSHVFVLLGFFIIFSLFLNKIVFKNISFKNKDFYLFFSILVLLFSVILISFSRSFWVGFLFGILFLIAGLIYKKINLACWVKFIFSGMLIFIFSIFLIFAVVKFPYPDSSSGFGVDMFTKRAGTLGGEAAISSRWSLLSPLLHEIKDNLIFGNGFGSLVTYQSSDPRVLESTVNGQYTTYAFEWGWLDMWLKIGLLGVLSYLYFLVKIILKGFEDKNNILSLALILGVIILSVVNIFTPYLNHPLGIGFLILVFLFVNAKKKDPLTTGGR